MLNTNSELPQIQTPAPADIPKPAKPRSYFFLLTFSIALLTGLIGFCLGRVSATNPDTSVLGAQTKSKSSRLLTLMRLNLERSNQDNLNISRESNLHTTEEGEKTIDQSETNIDSEEENENEENSNDSDSDSGSQSEDDSPEMIWGGTNRNPTPTPTPQIIIKRSTPTPEEVEEMNDGRKQKPTPTPSPEPDPEYKMNWDRNKSDPDELKPTEVRNMLENSLMEDNGISISTPKPHPTMPAKINSFINSSGLSFEKTEISQDEDQKNINVTAIVKDKMFGLLPISYPVLIKVSSDKGEITAVSLPWWRSLFGKSMWGNINQIVCGDGVCSSTESFDSCKIDCTPVCGNAICEYGEGTDTCPTDCMIPVEAIDSSEASSSGN